MNDELNPPEFQLTDAERALIGRWFQAGARVE